LEFREEECNDEDLEDLEPVRSGGEPGTVGAKVVISSRLVVSCVGCRDRAELIDRLVSMY